MKKKKLLEIAEMLEKHEDTEKLEFNMDTWYINDDCKTVCCAIGMAIHKKVLPLSIHINENNDPIYKGEWGYEALEEYFKISYDDTTFLFSPSEYINSVTKRKVANRIRKFVEGEK